MIVFYLISAPDRVDGYNDVAYSWDGSTWRKHLNSKTFTTFKASRKNVLKSLRGSRRVTRFVAPDPYVKQSNPGSNPTP